VKFYDISDTERRLWRQELNKIHGEHDTKRDALEYDYLLDAGKADEVHDLTDAAGEDLDELLAEIKMDTAMPPAYEYDPEHNVYFEDCVEGMRERLADDSVDCVITDPPYGFEWHGRREDEWGVLENSENFELFEDFLDQSRRVLKDGGHIYVWWGWQHYGWMEAEFRKRFEHLNTIVWNKKSVGLGDMAAKRYAPQYEVCFFGSVGDSDRRLSEDSRPADLITMERDSADEYNHPTQKPVALHADLLTNSTRPGDTVLDPFMGSGTTAVAAIQNDREYVGFEVDADNYRDVIERRIGEAKRQREAGVNEDAESDTASED
jgi:DNA modification methylase